MPEKLITSSEVSWLSFNARVLQEANNSSQSLKMRIRFLGIYSNNRDEFFRVRVALLKKMVQASQKQKCSLGKNPQRVLDQIKKITLQQQDDVNRIWKKIKTDLKKEKVFFIDDKHLNAEQKIFVRHIFDQEIRPSIIPLFIEEMPQLPSFEDDAIFLGIMMQKSAARDDKKFAIIEIPTKYHSRFISLPSVKDEQNIILLEDVVRFNLSTIFSAYGYKCFKAHMYKVTKDAEIIIDNDSPKTFIKQIENGLKNRCHAKAICFLYDKGMNKDLLKLLLNKLELTDNDNIIPAGPIRNFRDFMNFPAQLPDYPLRPSPFVHPLLEKARSITEVILQRDVLLFCPYHSFNSIIDLLCEAGTDPDVKSIKITGYRLAPNSKICNALINAVRNGKKVKVFLELRARFDEERNLKWKADLEEAGAEVFIGLPHMKVHAKICVIKKQVKDKVYQYGFVGTGNLNEKTALTYTDDFLLTSDPAIMSDVNRIFKSLEDPQKNWDQLNLCKTLLVSPVNMRDILNERINHEITLAKAGIASKIIVNINSLSDEKLIQKLYEAGEAGVEIEMIVRGIFLAETDRKDFVRPMTAISIVDEYLEHSRIWYFHNKGKEIIYISSADWMTRNLDHRIEVATPINDASIKEQLKYILKLKLSDDVKARRLDKELSNRYVSSKGKKKVRSQLAIYQYLKNKG
jgi:polyphosphate kinase